METLSTVFVVSDARDVGECLEPMIAAGELAVRRLLTADEALDFCQPDMPGCIVLDQEIGDASGLAVCEQLHEKGCQQPFLYVLRETDVPLVVAAMRHGAVNCIERPLVRERLMSGVRTAIAQDASQRRAQGERAEVLVRVESLTPRERQVLEFVAAGEITKSIARLLHISPKTVEVHRSNIMRKMHVDSAAALLHLVARYALFPFAADESLPAPDRHIVNESVVTEGQRSAGSLRCGCGPLPADAPRGVCHG